jgi:hypothetical protein
MDNSFLNHVFHPKTVKAPTGLRKSYLKVTPGRRLSRVNAFNKLPAVKQKVIVEAGAREDYLAGNITYAQAKGKLRTAAVKLGVTKPVRIKVSAREAAYTHILDLVVEQEQINPFAIAAHVKTMRADQVRDVQKFKNYPSFKSASQGLNADWTALDADGNEINLLWYH